ncbi:MAG: HAD family phosphatase [Prevotellaceae bacterium]|jgi:beta-phosphoglucomutase-like phosphatase (HAD superfamily)|nr:HAD family phosphatase [Prevotellaceae bacterium]
MITTVLFDFDGVIVETESQYDDFYDKLSEELNLDIPNFAAQIKGMQLKEVLHLKFPFLPEATKQKIIERTIDFDLQMDYPLVAGVMDFIDSLKKSNFTIGLVTSSMKEKMDIAMAKLGIQHLFDTVVVGDEISKGKPDPMCYLTAAQKLHKKPSECIVFEDSMAGIESALAAGMKVVGVATTLSQQELSAKVERVIPDFLNRTIEPLIL